MWPFSKLKSLKNENADLSTKNLALETELSCVLNKLSDFTTKKSLGRLIEVPRKIGDTLYVIMKREAYPEYDKELICMRRSDTVPENNIKVISITIVGYVIQPSGVYISFREQYDESKIYHINVNSPNLFLTLDAALAEVYNKGVKKKYMTNPFVVLKQEDVINIHEISTECSSIISDKEVPMNNINL